MPVFHDEGAPVSPATVTVPLVPGTLPAIALRAVDKAAMTPGELARAAAQYAKLGYTLEQLEVFKPDAGTATITPGPANGTGVVIDKAKAAAAYQSLIEHGMDPLVVAAEAAKQNIQVKDPRTGQFVGAKDGYTPPSYSLNYNGLLQGETPEQVAQFNATITRAFGSLGLTQSEAQAALSSFLQSRNAMPENFDEAEQQRRFEAEGRIIDGLSDSAEIKRLAVIGDAALKAADPDLYKALADNWALHSAASQIALANIGRKVEARK